MRSDQASRAKSYSAVLLVLSSHDNDRSTWQGHTHRCGSSVVTARQRPRLAWTARPRLGVLGQTAVQRRAAHPGQAQQLADVGSLLRGEAQRKPQADEPQPGQRMPGGDAAAARDPPLYGSARLAAVGPARWTSCSRCRLPCLQWLPTRLYSRLGTTRGHRQVKCGEKVSAVKILPVHVACPGCDTPTTIEFRIGDRAADGKWHPFEVPCFRCESRIRGRLGIVGDVPFFEFDKVQLLQEEPPADRQVIRAWAV